jgi:PEGA domain
MAGSLSRLSAQSAEPSSATSDAQDSTASQTTPAATKSAEPATEVSSKDGADSQVPAEKRKLRLRLGGISVGAGYSHFSGPYRYPYAYPYYYQPFGYYPGDWVGVALWYPVWSPYPYDGIGSFAYNNGRGEVRLTADPKVAEVYIDGGYAGTADKLRSLWLDPGAYDLTVSAAGREPFHQRLYVLSGKSLKITARLAGTTKEKP